MITKEELKDICSKLLSWYLEPDKKFVVTSVYYYHIGKTQHAMEFTVQDFNSFYCSSQVNLRGPKPAPFNLTVTRKVFMKNFSVVSSINDQVGYDSEGFEDPDGWEAEAEKSDKQEETQTYLSGISTMRYPCSQPNSGIYGGGTGTCAGSCDKCGTKSKETEEVEEKPECDHEWINVGFSSIKMVCKKCNVEKK